MSLSKAYANASHFATKRQILAIIAADLPISTLKAYFPGVTNDLIKEARTHAYQNGKHWKYFVFRRGDTNGLDSILRQIYFT